MTVHAIGAEATAGAAIYARITGRRFVAHAHATELAAASHDVVVCTTEQLTPALLYALYVDGPEGGAPGLIAAPDAAALEHVCRKQATAAIGGAAATGTRVFMYPMLGFETFSRGADLVVGGGLPLPRLREVLSSNADILAMFSHSDGVDLRLSLRHHACPFVDAADVPDRRRPACHVLSACVRFPEMPAFAAAVSDGSVQSMRALRARIAVISVCNGLRVDDGVVDASFNLATSLSSLADIGVIVTTWRRQVAVPADGAHLNTLVNEISAGATVGAAVARYNRSAFAKNYGVNLCIVGDPCVALRGTSGWAPLPVPVPPAAAAERSRIDALVEIVRFAMELSSAYDTERGQRIVESLRRGSTELGVELADFFAAAPWLDELFARVQAVEAADDDGVCPSCGARAFVTRARWAMDATSVRTSVRCARCDESRNAPSDWPVALDLSRVTEDLIGLVDVPPDAEIRVGFYYPWGPACHVHRWPAVGNAGLFRIPADLPTIPLKCQVVIARGLDVATLGFKLPAER